MRKLQALNLLSTPGVITTTDVVVTIVSDLDRALVQAPVMRLRLAAEVTDWDVQLAWLEGDEAAVDEAPVDPPTPTPRQRTSGRCTRSSTKPRRPSSRRAEARSASSSEKYTASDLGGRSAVTLVA